jgi:hypothetical protein
MSFGHSSVVELNRACRADWSGKIEKVGITDDWSGKIERVGITDDWSGRAVSTPDREAVDRTGTPTRRDATRGQVEGMVMWDGVVGVSAPPLAATTAVLTGRRNEM